MPRILIIDDSPVATLQLEHCLAKSGLDDLICVDSARKGLEILATCHDALMDDDETKPPPRPVDLILMDINMPDLDGIQATRILKADPCLQDIPIILISATEQKEVLEDGFAAGAIDFITKPIDLVELRARVRAALRLKQEMDRRKARERELEALTRKFEALSNQDGLTGIANRRRFDVVFATEWLRARREREPLSLLMIDIDFFKRYNDTYGHLQGDACLKAVARCIAHSLLRPADLAARYGGEEFVALLPGTDSEGALSVARHIQRMVAEMQIPHASSDVSEHVTVSVGGACATPGQDLGQDALLEAADRALYAAKDAGRNDIRIHPDHCAAPGELLRGR